MVADEHEASAADVACCRIDDREREADGYSCIDGIAALLEDFDAGVGGVVLDGDDHGVLAADGLVGWFLRGLLGDRSALGEQCGEECGTEDE
jgi:hypothetical protein